MYVGDEFCEQVVAKAVVLFHFDVVDELVIVERVSWAGGRDYVYFFLSEAAVMKHSGEEVNLVYWAESFPTGCLCVVQALVDDPHVRK